MKIIEKQTFDKKRMLYGCRGICVPKCRLNGFIDGSAITVTEMIASVLSFQNPCLSTGRMFTLGKQIWDNLGARGVIPIG